MNVCCRKIPAAIYCRKSSEYGLGLSFNSLHAQRESCLNYIRSQAHEGWIAVQDEYDDPGFSGGHLERPALQRLLRDIEAGKVDAVVCYRIDRLTRALTDFAKLVDIFEQKDISIVIITESFNTATSLGILNLHMVLALLSTSENWLANGSETNSLRRAGEDFGWAVMHRSATTSVTVSW